MLQSIQNDSNCSKKSLKVIFEHLPSLKLYLLRRAPVSFLEVIVLNTKVFSGCCYW